MSTFKIYNTDYYDENTRLYKSNKIKFEPNQIYCIVGCNGIGKSTLIKQIKDNLRKRAYDIGNVNPFKGLFSEKKLEDYKEAYLSISESDSTLNPLNNDDFIYNVLGTTLSTGERSVHERAPSFTYIEPFLDQLKGKTFYIFLDDLDVGVSVDVLVDYCNLIQRLEATLKRHDITYNIIMTANSYELAKYFKCISCVDFKEVKFKNYEDYKNFVMETRQYKDTRNQEFEHDNAENENRSEVVE